MTNRLLDFPAGFRAFAPQGERQTAGRFEARALCSNARLFNMAAADGFHRGKVRRGWKGGGQKRPQSGPSRFYAEKFRFPRLDLARPRREDLFPYFPAEGGEIRIKALRLRRSLDLARF